MCQKSFNRIFYKWIKKWIETSIGEKGIKLNGGKTKELLMKFIKRLSKNITIIMIAQRLSTLENCESELTIENREIL